MIEESQKIITVINELCTSLKKVLSDPVVVLQRKGEIMKLLLSIKKQRELLHKESQSFVFGIEARKKELSQLHLECENLKYELFNLKKETEICHHFESRHALLDLIPESEYMKMVPKEVLEGLSSASK